MRTAAHLYPALGACEGISSKSVPNSRHSGGLGCRLSSTRPVDGLCSELRSFGSIALEWDETPVFSVIPVLHQVRFRSKRSWHLDFRRSAPPPPPNPNTFHPPHPVPNLSGPSLPAWALLSHTPWNGREPCKIWMSGCHWEKFLRALCRPVYFFDPSATPTLFLIRIDYCHAYNFLPILVTASFHLHYVVLLYLLFSALGVFSKTFFHLLAT